MIIELSQHRRDVAPIVSAAQPGPGLRLSASVANFDRGVTFTADSVGVAAALGGEVVTLAGFDRSINLAAHGAGGMDTGSPPVSGFVSVYAIYNPADVAAALLGTTASQSTIYAGADMPAGYTMSGLISIWPTDGSRQLIPAAQVDRDLFFQVSDFPGQNVLTGGAATTGTAVDLSAMVPSVARAAYLGFTTVDPEAIDAASFSSFGATAAVREIICRAQVPQTPNRRNDWLPMVTPSTAYYASGDSAVQSSIQILGYRI